MRKNHFTKLLPLLLALFVLSACSSVDDSPNSPEPLGLVTPRDTSARALRVAIEVMEDQNATDGKSIITLQFKTFVVTEDYIVNFTHGETVTCNGVTAHLNASLIYSLRVERGKYRCSYTDYRRDIATMLDIPALSELGPLQLNVTSQGYTVRYKGDSSVLTCSIKADAIDSVHPSISGRDESSDLGVYQGPDVSSLTGTGTLLLQRTCSQFLSGPFAAEGWRYDSTDSIVVTWSH